MTQEQFNKLTKYRDSLYTATNLDYVRVQTIEDKQTLHNLYKEIFNKDSGIMGGCTRCLLRDIKTLGKSYFEFEKQLKEQDEQPKSKKGRPKTKPTNNS